MTAKRIKVKRFAGVYAREHSTRRHDGKPDKCFEINFRVGGKLHFEKIGWASEGYSAQGASQIRGERIRTLRHGKELPLKKKHEITIADVWEKYLEWATQNRKSFLAEENRYKKHIEPLLGKLAISSITPILLEELKGKLSKNNYSEQTIKHVLVLIRQMINKAISWELWNGENPIRKIKIPRPNNKRERFLTQEEVKILLNELGKISPKCRDVSLLSLSTGMRAGEIFSLKWGHVNFDEKLIYIQTPKPGEAQHVYLSDIAKAVLARLFFAEKTSPSPEEFVFKSRSGTKIREVSKTFGRAVKKLDFNAGIGDRRHKIVFHSLRHTFGSWLALEETYFPVLQELMRHSTPEMTKRYSHLTPDHKRDGILKIENRLKLLLTDDAGQSFI